MNFKIEGNYKKFSNHLHLKGKNMNFKKILKPYFFLPSVLILLLLVVFIGWHIVPSKNLDVVVVDKSVSAGQSLQSVKQSDIVSGYRKHIGLFWLLNDIKYRNPLTGKPYDSTKDYYGDFPSSDGTVENKDLERLSETPDIVYLSDTYGDAEGNANKGSGLSYYDMAAASSAHTTGATIIGESDLTTGTNASIIKEIQSTFGFAYSEWVGKYITDMKDMSQVPSWATSLYEREYGYKWNMKGPGLLITSKKREIVVLQQGVDFSGEPLSIEITPKYQKKFGKLKVNYYNWFEIVSGNYGTNIVAQYRLNLNKTGQKKFDRISTQMVFPAITEVTFFNAPAYYFAGDFNDCVGENKYTKFLFSSMFYRFFSIDREGDITNFYWKFYRPVMGTILNDAYHNRANVMRSAKNAKATVKIQDNQFQILKDDKWHPLDIKGFNLSAVMPGSQAYDYTRDITTYSEFLSELKGMGGNCIRADDLLAPEFYRALYQYNRANPGKTIYLMQTISPADNIVSESYGNRLGMEQLKKNIEHVEEAIHGNATVPKEGSRNGGVYIDDVSPYLLGYIVKFDNSAGVVQALNGKNPKYTYDGAYVSSSGNCAEGIMAALCDYAFSYHEREYGYMAPIGAVGNAALLPGLPWTPVSQSSLFNVNGLKASKAAEGYFFLSYALQPSDLDFLNNTDAFSGYHDDQGSLPYGGYIKAVKDIESSYPILIDGMGLPTNVNAFQKETSVNGLSESDQGNGLVRMLEAVKRENFLGALISDLDDQWCVSSQGPYNIPKGDKPLWQDATDPLENRGILALEPAPPEKIGLTLTDTGRMKELQLSINDKYIYATIALNNDINYDIEQLMVGLDTYLRNNGEYRYDPSYFATSLSGMEYLIKFEGKNSAGLYCLPAYDKSKDSYASRESYKGNFNYIAPLKYGSFDSSDGEFYQTGSTIHIRIPWRLLNFTDPAKKIVLNDGRTKPQILNDPFGFKTIKTEGIIFSILIANKQTKDTEYIFPENKQSDGYRIFSWDDWMTPTYRIREKESYAILANYFQSLK